MIRRRQWGCIFAGVWCGKVGGQFPQAEKSLGIVAGVGGKEEWGHEEEAEGDRELGPAHAVRAL